MAETTTAPTAAPTTVSTTPTVHPAAAAADWWASRFLPSTPLRFDNGDESQAGGLTMAYAILQSVHVGYPPAESVAAFRTLMARDLADLLETRSAVWIEVDYGPDVFLASRLGHAGLGAFASQLPWKTYMRVSKDSVTVSVGYQAPWETLYSAPAPTADAKAEGPV